MRFLRFIIKKEHIDHEFDKMIQILFEKTKNKELREGNFHPEIEAMMVSNEEFEAQFIIRYDSVKDLVPQMDQEVKEEVIKGSIKFFYMFTTDEA